MPAFEPQENILNSHCGINFYVVDSWLNYAPNFVVNWTEVRLFGNHKYESS